MYGLLVYDNYFKVLYFPRFWEIVIINVVFILIGNFIYLILVIFLRDVTIGIRANVLKIS